MTIQDIKTSLFIDAYQSGSELLVILKGRLVLENCDGARKRLHTLLTDKIDKFYIYLGRLDFVDSAGWGAMVGLKMAANRNRTRLVFLTPTQRIMEIFKISKLDTIFEILSGPEAEAIRSALVKRENLLWRDSPDESQNRFKTEDESFTPHGGAPASTPRTPLQPLRAERQKETEKLSRDAVEHLRHGDYQKAIELYRRVIELDPEDLSAMNNLGVVYEKKPEWFGEARKVWKRVLELSESRNDAKHAERAKKHLEFLSGK
ncbi:tetratricopeptide repeat protein [Candidatus Sumerlaeota bacterium]|nr:tetratricopeptide repeat protein [Candidatus Sumerlaeota bacterium]